MDLKSRPVVPADMARPGLPDDHADHDAPDPHHDDPVGRSGDHGSWSAQGGHGAPHAPHAQSDGASHGGGGGDADAAGGQQREGAAAESGDVAEPAGDDGVAIVQILVSPDNDVQVVAGRESLRGINSDGAWLDIGDGSGGARAQPSEPVATTEPQPSIPRPTTLEPTTAMEPDVLSAAFSAALTSSQQSVHTMLAQTELAAPSPAPTMRTQDSFPSPNAPNSIESQRQQLTHAEDVSSHHSSDSDLANPSKVKNKHSRF